MNVDIVIPTINGARWLGQLLDGYRNLGVEPLYALDSRCDDGSLELLRARAARIVLVHQQGFHVENGVLAQISPFVERDWILRLDDDEFPSAALLKWAAQTTAPADILSWYLPRLTLYRDEGRIKYSRVKTHYHNYPHSRLIDPQCRLYRHRDVTYVTDIHSCGFEPGHSRFAPQSAHFLHLDALLRAPDERLAKLRHYEGIKPRSSWKYAYHYLPDVFPAVQNPAIFKAAAFAPLIASLPQPSRRSELSARDLSAAQSAAARYLRAWHLRRSRNFGQPVKNAIARPLSHKPLAEFICTSARFLAGQTWVPRPWPRRLLRIGRELYWRASLRAPTGAKGDEFPPRNCLPKAADATPVGESLN